MTSAQPDYRELLQRSLEAIDTLERRLDASERRHHEPIAVIGMGLRFPGGVRDPDSFWELLLNGRDAIGEIPRERWDLDAMFDPDPDAPGKSYARWGGFIDGVDEFDATFFGISPREAISMDPQQRLLLQVAWEAMEHAGIPPTALAGTAAGVFAGIIGTEYADLALQGGVMSDVDAYFASGVAQSVAAGRLAYAFDLRGPAVAVDTACSSSLVATHLACQALRTGDCDTALAGGVSVMISPDAFILTSQARMLSFEGRCKTFDAAADGYVRGEGCAVLVLKRLSDALTAGDRILGTIRGTAMNQDGRSAGLTAPNAAAQEAVIRVAALADGSVEPGAVGFVECHGTGTTLGDPIEIRALQAVFGPGRPAERPLRVQSVKTNIGHLEAGAGIAGLCKLILALDRGVLPVHLHLTDPNPYIPWADIGVVAEKGPWRWAEPDSQARVGGISSFGFSGTNVHMVVEQGPAQASADGPRRPHRVYPVSARTEDALLRLAGAHAKCLREFEPDRWDDAAVTATTGRAHLEERLAIVASSADLAAGHLEAVSAGADATVMARGRLSGADDGVTMLFTGQGSQRAGMGAKLHATEPAFRSALEECARILTDLSGLDLLQVMFSGRWSEANLSIHDTRCTQPALFAYEVALAALWRSWGVEPVGVLGHSIGELAAAHIAGVFSLEDALTIVDARARLMQDLPRGGAMAAVLADINVVRAAIEPYPDRLSIAARNGPRNVVISGGQVELDCAAGALEAGGVKVVRLEVSHAFHSPLMESILDDFERVVGSVSLREPEIELISNATGAVATPGLLTTPRYWRDHVREPVLFESSMRHAVGAGHRRFLEIGPASTLTAMAKACGLSDEVTFYGPGRRSEDEALEVQRLLAALHVDGVEIDWRGYEGSTGRGAVTLPTYPFASQRFWHPSVHADHRGVSAAAAGLPAMGDEPLLGHQLRSPRLDGVVFERSMSSRSPAWLSGHVIHGATILPAAAFVELMRRAGNAGLGLRCDLLDVRVDAPLVLTDDSPRLVQTVIDDGGAGTVEVLSADGDDGSWQRHASGHLVPERPADASGREDLVARVDAAWSGCVQLIDGDRYYDALARLGVDYGGSFLGLVRAARRDGEVVATLTAPEDPDEPGLHPGLVDACLQVLGLAMPGGGDLSGSDDVYMPVGVERWHVSGDGVGTLTALGRVRGLDGAPTGEVMIGDFELVDASGRLVAAMEGVRFKRAPRQALAARPGAERDWLYVPHWIPALPGAIAPRGELGGRWILVGSSELAAPLADRMRAGGANAVEIAVEPSAGCSEADDQLTAALASPADGVVVLFPLRSGDPAYDAAWAAHLISRVAVVESAPPITFATSDAMVVVPGDRADHAEQAAVWGVGRVARLEHPRLVCQLVDVSRQHGLDQLLAELALGDRDEPEVAWRDTMRYAQRLARASEIENLAVPDGPYELVITERGRLDALRLEQQAELEPGPGQVLVDIRATGLNFRDVLDVLGRYPGAAPTLGGECAGVVAAVGPGVERVRPGDRVMTVATSSFATRCVVPEQMAVRQPAGWTDAQAASVPIAFLTADYALNQVGALRAGERVLVHAAAGGVGMAAVQLALRAEAEVFATAGSDAKRDAVKAMGVRHVYDSRRTDFRDEVLRDTGGAGVDLVLNSLSGDAIDASVEVLSPAGRFLEIGMAGVWDAETFARCRPDAEYHLIYLGQVCVDQPDLIARMLDGLVEDFERGALAALPITAFDIRRSVDAFRYMAQARHIGKVVVTALPGWNVADAKGTWIVSGGLGGLGLATATELAQAGATRLVLCSRRPDDADTGAELAELRRRCDDVRVTALDVTDADAVSRMVADVTADGTPLRGVVHAAGVLDDGLLRSQTAERFSAVLGPKVEGARNLAAATDAHHPEHFIVFSAGAGLLGSAGQGSYAAANAALDAMAHARRAAGLPAQALGWGPWTTVGMASRLDGEAIRRWEAQGVVGIDPVEGRRALRSAVADGAPQLAVMKLRWPALLHHLSKHGVPPVLRDLVQAEQGRRVARTEGSAPSDLLARLDAATVDDRRDLLQQHVRLQVLRVLGLEPRHPIDPHWGLTDLGMDSLMAVELSNRLSVDVGRTLPSTLAFERPTLEDLTDHLAEVLADRFELGPSVVSARSAAAAGLVDEALDELTDGEVADALLHELEEAGY